MESHARAAPRLPSAKNHFGGVGPVVLVHGSRPRSPPGFGHPGVIVSVAAHGGRVAPANPGATPLRAHRVEAALRSGAPPAEAAAHAAEGTSAGSDFLADREYREHLPGS
ncbi:hypothetical protein ACWD5R_15375 [Streptomyces sp. NPDC002514]|uniref:hypothetical protein n=1 Tax=Streptomyces sp. NPDC001270 TaxID=3364554 RepID=UPI0036808FCB